MATLHCIHGWSFINGQYPYKLARSIQVANLAPITTSHLDEQALLSLSFSFSRSPVHQAFKTTDQCKLRRSSHPSFRQIYFPCPWKRENIEKYLLNAPSLPFDKNRHERSVRLRLTNNGLAIFATLLCCFAHPFGTDLLRFIDYYETFHPLPS